MKTVCDTYLVAPERERIDQTHTVSVDEMTGLQTLERIAPSKSMIAGQCELIEFESARHGTLCLIGNFVVTTGELRRPTIGPTRTETDFASPIEPTVAADPKGSWVFVMDNLNIHCLESWVRLVAGACEVPTDLGKKRVRGVLKSVASRPAFLSESSHRIRFVDLPKHSSWLNQIEVVFGVIMRKVIRRGSFTSVEDLRTKWWDFIDLFPSSVRQAVPLDVHGSSADEGSGVKLGKRASQGMSFASLAFKNEKSVSVESRSTRRELLEVNVSMQHSLIDERRLRGDRLPRP